LPCASGFASGFGIKGIGHKFVFGRIDEFIQAAPEDVKFQCVELTFKKRVLGPDSVIEAQGGHFLEAARRGDIVSDQNEHSGVSGWRPSIRDEWKEIIPPGDLS
jgi:hypothetical protein